MYLKVGSGLPAARCRHTGNPAPVGKRQRVSQPAGARRVGYLSVNLANISGVSNFCNSSNS